jgi:hypothetical protein
MDKEVIKKGLALAGKLVLDHIFNPSDSYRFLAIINAALAELAKPDEGIDERMHLAVIDERNLLQARADNLAEALEKIANVDGYWCMNCKMSVPKDHNHYQATVPIAGVREADELVGASYIAREALAAHRKEG